jgi:hypothetical protein
LNSRSCLTSILESEDTVIVAVLGIIYAAIRSAALFQILTAAIKRSISAVVTRQRPPARAGRGRPTLTEQPALGCAAHPQETRAWPTMTSAGKT